jgi:hypothetical protein
MTVIAVPEPRSTVIDLGGELQITIPAPRQVFGTVFTFLWLGGWAFGEIMVTRAILASKSVGANTFMFLWLVAWTVGGAWAIYEVLWWLTGRERVNMDMTSLKLRREVLGGIGRGIELDLAHVRRLRVAPELAAAFGMTASAEPRGYKRGIIAFDYGARTFRFGLGLDEAEAAAIVEKLAARSPGISSSDVA